MVYAEIHSLIEKNSGEEDPVVFTEGSVQRGDQSGLAYTVRVRGSIVAEKSGTLLVTTSSMAMEVKVITEALIFEK